MNMQFLIDEETGKVSCPVSARTLMGPHTGELGAISDETASRATLKLYAPDSPGCVNSLNSTYRKVLKDSHYKSFDSNMHTIDWHPIISSLAYAYVVVGLMTTLQG